MRRVVSTGLAVLLLSGCVLRVSSDPFTNATSQHRTQVEPDTFSFGSTIVSAFQSGRFFDGGASDIGWSTSTDGGAHWTTGFLSGVTTFQGNGAYGRASDPSVAYDARDRVWLISSLALDGPSSAPFAVLVSASSDGRSWEAKPAVVASGTGLDKEWIVCDNHASSPFYGRCVVEYDDTTALNALRMATSTDGGTTWTASTVPASVHGLGGQPLVQSNGKIVVPYWSAAGSIAAISSVNGGATYSAAGTIASITDHQVAGGLRTEPLPSAASDGAGNLYVVWQDCRFRTGCTQNDLVMSKSSNGASWSPVARIPIDAASSSLDHFIPGLDVDISTSGNTARLALVYYFYPNRACTPSTCQLEVGFIDSTNGGSTWGPHRTIAGPMSLSWLARTNQGAMVGDYISTSFANGKAHPVFALAHAPNGSALDEAMHTIVGGLPISGGTATSVDAPVLETPAKPPTPTFPTSN